MLKTPGMAHALAGGHACDQPADAPEKLPQRETKTPSSNNDMTTPD